MPGERRPVVVVGGGPVGLVSALLLAVRGVDVVLVERERAPSALPRAVHLDDEALRVLDDAGVLEALAPGLTPAPAYELRDARGRLLHTVRRAQRPAGHPASSLFHQPTAERLLRAAVEADPRIDARWGWAVRGVRPVPAGVVATDPDGREHRLAAAAVLACDGAASTVRRLLHVPVRDRGYDQTWAVVDLHLPDRPAHLANPQQRCGGPRPATSVPTGPRRHRVELMALPGEDPEALLRPAVLEPLLAGWGLDPATAAVERAAVYTFHALRAQRWRVGDVFLVGDAAHQMPPFLGQGLGAGLRDAANLAWKLALVHRGRAGTALLDTYERERAPQVDAAIRLTVLLGRFITARGPGADAARRTVAAALRTVPALRAAGDALRPPPLPAGPLVARRGLGPAGHPFPSADLRAGGEVGDAALGRGFALVGLGSDPLAGADGATRAVWAALGARRLAVPASGALGAWFAGAEVAVVRPDRVVLGVGRRADLPALTVGLARLLRPPAGRGSR